MVYISNILTPWKLSEYKFSVKHNVLFATIISILIASLNIFCLATKHNGNIKILLSYFTGYLAGTVFSILVKSYLIKSVFIRYNSQISFNSIFFIVICAAIPEAILVCLSKYTSVILLSTIVIIWCIYIITSYIKKLASKSVTSIFIIISLIYFITYIVISVVIKTF